MYDKLPYAPNNYHICPCCSTEFGNDDAEFSHNQLREMWIAGGANWFFNRPPTGWNPWLQLLKAGLGSYIPRFFTDIRFQSDAVVMPDGIIGPENKYSVRV
jgi:hypothetical protein